MRFEGSLADNLKLQQTGYSGRKEDKMQQLIKNKTHTFF